MIRSLLLLWCTSLALLAVEHRFLVLDNGGNRLVLVDQARPDRGWSIAIPSGGRDLQRLGDRVLVSHGTGATEYALADGKPAWSWTGSTGISSARRLTDGTTLFVRSGALLRLAPGATAPQELPVAGLEGGRLVREDGPGRFLIGLSDAKVLLSVREDGQVLGRIPLPGKGYVGLRLPNGHLLASTGAAVSVLELDAQGAVVRTFGGQQAHPQARLLWFSGFQRLANGDVVVANWCGHGHEGQGPHAIQFDADNRLVWSWEDHRAAASVTNLLILDD